MEATQEETWDAQIAKRVGAELKRRRRTGKVPVSRIMAGTGIAKASIYRHEQAEVGMYLATAILYARFYNCSVEDLVGPDPPSTASGDEAEQD